MTEKMSEDKQDYDPKEIIVVHEVNRVGITGPVLIDDMDDVRKFFNDFLVEKIHAIHNTLLIRKTATTRGVFDQMENYIQEEETRK